MPDFGFVGPSYVAQSIYQDDQETINWYPETDPNKQPTTPLDKAQRGVTALYPTPGLILRTTFANGGPVRGLYTLPGGAMALAVAGSTLYTLTASGTTYTATAVGTLLTATGQVGITDNGIAAMIVDGPNRYFYEWGAATFTTSTDGAFTGATACDIVDNFIIYNNPGTQQWGCTDALSTISNPLNFSSKDGSSDNLVSLIVVNRQVFLMGEVTYEVWSDAGLSPFPFQRIPGTSKQHGVVAQYSIARLGEGFAWLTRDTRGVATVALMVGYEPKRISTFAVEVAMERYARIDDAIAYTYQQAGHEFYVLSFPTADVTWVYDLATQLWHKRAWRDSHNVLHRHRSNCMASFNNEILVGDHQSGNLYAMSIATYTDNGDVLPCIRRCPHITSDLQRQYFSDFQIQFQPGVGLQGNSNLGEAFMVAPGSDGDFALTPDSAALDIATDFEIISYIAPDDWTPTSNYIILRKGGDSAPNRAYGFVLVGVGVNRGRLQLTVSSNGSTNQVSEFSTVVAGGSDGEGMWVRVTFDADNGAAGSTTTFYTSTDAQTTQVGSVSWTQLGAAVVGTLIASISNTSAGLGIGASATIGAGPFNGKIYSAYLYNGIGGTLVAQFNPNNASLGATSWASATTGETWTLQGNASLSGQYVQGSDPQAMLKWSDDGGSTWSSEHWTSIGKVGKYKHRAIWRRLGQARDRIFEVQVTDPVFRTVVSANLNGSPGAA